MAEEKTNKNVEVTMDEYDAAMESRKDRTNVARKSAKLIDD